MDEDLSSDDVRFTSLGRLALPEGMPAEPGETVMVERFQVSLSPAILTAIGVRPDMSDEEAYELISNALRRAAESLNNEAPNDDEQP